MRLIDGDNIRLGKLSKYIKTTSDFKPYITLEDLQKVLDAQPTAYDVDKVIERLKKYSFNAPIVLEGIKPKNCNLIFREQCLAIVQQELIKIDNKINELDAGQSALFAGIGQLLDIQEAAENANTTQKHECKDCARCTQCKCDKSNAIQEYKENLIEKLQDKVKEYDERIEKRKGPTFFDETERIKKFDERAWGIEIAIEIVKGGAGNVDITNKEEMV